MRAITLSRSLNYLAAALLLIGFLENFGSGRYALMVPILMLMWVFHLIENESKVERRSTIAFVVIIFAVLILALPSSLGIFPHKNNINYGYLEFVLATSFKLFCAYSVVVCLKNSDDRLKRVIRTVLIINIGFFFIQLVIVYLTSYYLDPLQVVTGERQRYLSGFTVPLLGSIYRPTGFFEEPSTYSGFILCLIACKLYVEPKIDKLVVLSVFSIICSLSVAAIAYGIIFMSYLLLRRKGNLFKYFIFLFSPFLLAGLSFLVAGRLSSIDTATSIRANLFLLVFSQSHIEILWGNGLLGVMDSVAPYMEKGDLWRANIASLNDNGLWLFIIMKLGVIGLICCIILLVRRLKHFTHKMVFILLLFTKLSLLYFGLIFYFVLVSAKESRNVRFS